MFLRLGSRLYDPKAENHRRWINLSIKVFIDLLLRRALEQEVGITELNTDKE